MLHINTKYKSFSYVLFGPHKKDPEAEEDEDGVREVVCDCESEGEEGAAQTS